MHEAGLAMAIAAEMRARLLDPRAVRLIVTGGHGDAEAFDTALRMHLALALPAADVGSIVILHEPMACLCAACGLPFEGVDRAARCNACGGEGLVVPTPEQIAIEWGDVASGGWPADRGPERPRGHDVRLSSGDVGRRQTRIMTDPVVDGLPVDAPRDA